MLPGVDPVRHAVALGFRDEPFIKKCLVIIVQPELLGGAAPLLLIAELLLFSQYVTPSLLGSVFPVFTGNMRCLLGSPAPRAATQVADERCLWLSGFAGDRKYGGFHVLCVPESASSIQLPGLVLIHVLSGVHEHDLRRDAIHDPLKIGVVRGELGVLQYLLNRFLSGVLQLRFELGVV